MAEEIYYEPSGRAYRKEFFTKKIPVPHYVHGKFSGKFHSDKVETANEKNDFYEFKIYEAEVEILAKSRAPLEIPPESTAAIVIAKEQLPEKTYYFEKTGNEKIYYDISLQQQEFRNFHFVRMLQQNEDTEAFGTVEGDVYGILYTFREEIDFRKNYLNKQTENPDIVPPPKPKKEAEKTADERKKVGVKVEFDNVHPTEKNALSACQKNLLYSLALLSLSLIFGFVPGVFAGFLWLVYTVFKCYFRWVLYLFYAFLLLFFAGLLFALFTIDFNRRAKTYVPPKEQGKPRLVKVITYIDKNQNEDLLISHNIRWKGYHGEEYAGEYSIKKSDLDASRNFKNDLSSELSFPNIYYNLSRNDDEKLEGVYRMFDEIRAGRKLSDRKFAEMIVSFAQHFPYHLIVNQSCNPQLYSPQIQEVMREHPQNCVPYQKFGITSPAEFMATGQGDCDSRTVLLYTILKHYGYDVAIFTSEYYAHSILGVALPYQGINYSSGGRHYALWETTSKWPPGVLPPEITNLNYWELTLK